MYLDHFGLVADPFALSPDLRLLYLTQSHEETMAHLAYGLEQGEEVIVLTGSIGMGKTLALQCLAERISPQFTWVFVSSTKMDFRGLLKMILWDLSVSIAPDADLADLHNAFKKVLQKELNNEKRLLLIVDEAQNLSPDTLESLRLLLSLAPPGKNNLSIVIAGQPGLNQNINLPELAQLRQRIRVHYHMEPLTRKETKAYINYRTNECGQNSLIFRDNAIDTIFSLSKGVPRLVNHLASQALLAAYVAGARDVSKKHLTTAEIPERESVVPLSTSAENGFEEKGPETEGEQKQSSPPAPPPGTQTYQAESSLLRRLGMAVLLLTVVASVAFFWPQISDFVTTQYQTVSTSPSSPDTIHTIDSQEVTQKMKLIPEPHTTTLTKTSPPPTTVVLDSVAPLPNSHEIPTELVSAPVSSQVATVEKNYAIHIASFRNSDRAQAHAELIEKAGYPVFVESVIIQDSEWFRVYVGKFGQKDVALEAEQRLVANNFVEYSTIIEL